MKAPDWKKQKPEREEKRDFKLTIHLASEIKPGAVRFLWFPYIPFGAITTLEGDGGLGKSTIACALAASLSNGYPLPGEPRAAASRGPLRILIAAAEDEKDRVIQPRLAALGANLSNIGIIDEPFPLDAKGIKALEAAIRGFDATIIFIDPIVAYMRADKDMNKALDVREMMSRLALVARVTKSAIIIVRHFGKSKKADHHMGLGSVDFTNAARSQMQAVRWDGGKTVLQHTKANYSQLGDPLEYTVTAGQFDPISGLVSPGVFEWVGPVVGAKPIISRTTRSKSDAAKEFLRELLAAGPLPARVVQERGEEAGFSWDLLKRVKSGVALSIRTADAWEWRGLGAGD